MHTAGSSGTPPRAPGLAALAAACLALAALAWLAIAPATPPAPPPAPPHLERMLRHVAVLAAEPRPIATEANARARDYILGQLRGMGLHPLVQKTTVQKSVIQYWGGRHVTLGVVHNILVRIPGGAAGSMGRPALLLATHYDTGKTTLGAARSSAQVAALLETARLLRAGPARANDIVLLFADGENVGALGAQGFAWHPWAQQVGLALRFDSAGSGGPLVLYDAAGAGSDVLRGLAGAAPATGGTSLLAGLVKLLPDTLRIGPLASLDAPVLLLANTGMRFDTEKVLDTPQRLDPAMLAGLGDTMLRLAHHFGDAPLARGARGTHSYFDLPLVGSVRHSALLSWALAALSCLLLARAYRQALAQSDTTVAPLVKGFFGIALVLLAARMGLWERREEVAALARSASIEPALVFGVMCGCLFVGALYLLRWLAGGVPVFLGAMAWVTAVLGAVLVVAPAAAYVLAWPLAAALAAFTALQAVRSLPVRLAIAAAGLLPAIVLLLPALRDAWTGLAAQGLYVPALAIAILMLLFASMLLLLPLGRVAGPALALAFAGCAALPPSVSSAAAPAPQERPAVEPDRLVYFKDMNSWRAYWLLPPQPLDAWSKGLFPDLAQPAIHVDVFGWHSPRQWYAVAPREDRIAFPEAFLLKNPALAWTNAKQTTRQVEFTLRSKNRAPHIELWAAGTKPLRSTMNGRVLTASEGGWSMSLYGMDDQVLRFTFDAKAEDLLAIVVEERMPGLPTHLLPPGAPPRMPGTGMTISSDVLRFY